MSASTLSTTAKLSYPLARFTLAVIALCAMLWPQPLPSLAGMEHHLRNSNPMSVSVTYRWVADTDGSDDLSVPSETARGTDVSDLDTVSPAWLARGCIRAGVVIQPLAIEPAVYGGRGPPASLLQRP